jgi:hypothetical protein
MSKHVNQLSGLEFLIQIDQIRGSGGACLGSLVDRETEEIVFESDFPSYGDAYRALMEMDANAWLGSASLPESRVGRSLGASSPRTSRPAR